MPSAQETPSSAIDLALARRLVDSQFPRYGNLPLVAVEPGGWDILLNELQLYSAFGLQGHRYNTMLGMCKAGLLDPARLVTKAVGLDGIMPVLGRYETVGVVAIDFEIEG